MNSPVTLHPWSQESLFCKAQLFFEQMESHNADDWQFGLWSALGLELLCRSALAHVSPVLLADNRGDWRNLAHALGRDPTTKKFTPVSVPTKVLVDRLSELVPTLSQEEAGFCLEHMSRRNSELHSGDLVFQSLGTSSWLPRFYSVCKVLLESMDREIADLFSDTETAHTMIESLRDTAAQGVKQDIKAHQQVWSNKSSEEKEGAASQAEMWATKHKGHRVTCPSCQSIAILQGDRRGTVTTRIKEEDDTVMQRQTVVPSSFECIACGLRIAGLSKLSACGLGNSFSETSTYSIAEHFNLYTEDDLQIARVEHLYDLDHYDPDHYDPDHYGPDYNE